MALIQSECTTFLSTGQTSNVYSPPSAVTPGNLVVFGIVPSNRQVSSIVGDVSSTATINGAHTAWAGGNVTLWKGIASGADTEFTITYSGAIGDTVAVGFAEFSDASSDQSGATANGGSLDTSTGPHTSGSVTPPTANNVVVAVQGRTSGTWTDDTDFTAVSAANATLYLGYRIQSSAAATTFDSNSADNEFSGTRIGAFAGTGGGATGNPYYAFAQQ